METEEKLLLGQTAGDPLPKVLIKQKLEWLPEDSHATDLVKQELVLHLEPLRYIKTEDVSYTDAEAPAVHGFTPVYQTDEYIKTELMLDEELRDNMNDSEATCQLTSHSNSPKALQKVGEVLAHSEVKLTCEFCPGTFKNKYILKNHLLTHTKPTNRAFACDICERTFSNKFSFRRHKKVHSKLTCQMCGLYFTQESNLKAHMLNKHLDKPEPNMINDDSINSQTEEVSDEAAGSWEAQGDTHDGSQSTSACEVCHCIYPIKYMKAHMHLAHAKHKHKCEFCSHSFRNKYDLKVHVNTHAKDRKPEFACDLCERTFYNKGNLGRHRKVHIGGTRKRQMLNPHLDGAHGAQTAEDDPKTTKPNEFLDNDHGRQPSALQPADMQQDRVSPSQLNSEFCQKKGNAQAHLPAKHSDKTQSTSLDRQTVHNDSINTKEELFSDEDAVSFGQESQQNALQGQVVTSDMECETCDVCHNVYLKEIISTHMRLEHSNYKYKCEFCSHSFKTKPLFKMHLKTHQPTDTKWACDLCERTFPTRHSLGSHKKIHSRFPTKFNASDGFKCKTCGKKYTRNENLKLHMLRKHLDEVQQTISGPQTADDDSMNSNQILNNTQAEKATFECGICSESFETEIILKMHLTTHAQERQLQTVSLNKTQNVQLPTSNDDAVPTKTELISDEEFIDEVNQPDSVSHEKRTETTALDVDDGQRARVSTAPDSAACDFRHNSHPADLIEKHIHIKNGIQTYKCPYCPRVCFRSSIFRKHISTHDENRTRPFACEQCGSNFLAEVYLTRHIITHHSNNRRPEFYCELCRQKFRTKVGCDRHMRTCERQRRNYAGETVSCGVCGVGFTRKQILRKHMLRKHSNKTQQFTPDPQTANGNSLQIKEELVSDNEFLDEETNTTRKSIECPNDS